MNLRVRVLVSAARERISQSGVIVGSVDMASYAPTISLSLYSDEEDQIGDDFVDEVWGGVVETSHCAERFDHLVVACAGCADHAVAGLCCQLHATRPDAAGRTPDQEDLVLLLDTGGAIGWHVQIQQCFWEETARCCYHGEWQYHGIFVADMRRDADEEGPVEEDVVLEGGVGVDFLAFPRLLQFLRAEIEVFAVFGLKRARLADYAVADFEFAAQSSIFGGVLREFRNFSSDIAA